MSLITAIYFWSPTCEPCKALKPVIEDLKEEFSDIQWISVNIKNDPSEISKKYGITQVPTIVGISATGEIKKQMGRDTAAYYRLLRAISQ